MPGKIMEFVKQQNGYRLKVHLDTARTLPDENDQPQPDPAWVHEWTFPNLHPEIHTQGDEPLTESQFIENLMDELPRMVEVERHHRGQERAGWVTRQFEEHHGKEIH